MALALVATLVGITFGIVERRERQEGERRVLHLQAELAEATRAGAQAHIDLQTAVAAEAERDRKRRRDEAAELEEQTLTRFQLRDPIVTVPAGLDLCRARDLEVLSPGGPFSGVTLANRTRRPCGLPDHPVLQALDEGGRWRTIPVLPSLASSYTDGPAWTGALVPGKVAVLAVDQRRPLRSGVCLGGTVPSEDFSAVRLVLAPQAEPLVVPDSTLSIGPCRPEVLLWAYDHEGA